jgi:hypothetical protein
MFQQWHGDWSILWSGAMKNKNKNHVPHVLMYRCAEVLSNNWDLNIFRGRRLSKFITKRGRPRSCVSAITYSWPDIFELLLACGFGYNLYAHAAVLVGKLRDHCGESDTKIHLVAATFSLSHLFHQSKFRGIDGHLFWCLGFLIKRYPEIVRSLTSLQVVL